MIRLASLFFGLVACGLFGFGAYQYVTPGEPPPGEAVTIDEPARDLGPLPLGNEIPLRFRIKNKSAQPVRILGFSQG